MSRRALTTEERAAVVAEAKSWLGTPFHHEGDVKGSGVDCGMLLVRVYCDLNLAPLFDPRPYPQQWYMHQSEERYKSWIEKYCEPIDVKEALPGDLLLYRFGRCAAHAAIVLDSELMLHAYQPAGVVEIRERRAPLVHGTLDSVWSPRIEE